MDSESRRVGPGTEIAVATVGLERDVLSPRIYTVVLVVAVVTSATTAALLRRVLGGIADVDADTDADGDDPDPRVVDGSGPS